LTDQINIRDDLILQVLDELKKQNDQLKINENVNDNINSKIINVSNIKMRSFKEAYEELPLLKINKNYNKN